MLYHVISQLAEGSSLQAQLAQWSLCDRRKDSAALRYVDEALRGDRDFVLGALQRNAEAVDFAGF